MRYIVVVLFFLTAAACQSPEDQGHSHGETGDHSHDNEGKPSVDYTVWTDQTELFVEFPVLVVGETSRFAAHFTLLEGHKAVREGSLTVSLMKGEKGIRNKADAPSSPGIFGVGLQPKEPGIYQLIFELQTPVFSDRITLNNIQVFATPEEAAATLSSSEEEGGISFLKEQAWKMEFQTASVQTQKVYQTLSTSGVWKVAPSDYQTLVAPASGRVNFSAGIWTIGSAVKKGQVLMTVTSAGLTSNNLDAEIEKARVDLQQATAEYERKKELYQSKIVPKAALEQSEQKYLLAKTQYETLSEGYNGVGKQITSPENGFIKSIFVNNGAFADQGAALAVVTSHKSSLLEFGISPAHVSELQHIQNIWYQPAPGTWSNTRDSGGKIVSIGKEVEPNRPLIPILVEVKEDVLMPEGGFTEIQLAIGVGEELPTVPVSALLEDYGNYSVIVQRSGETFERRNVVVGQRNGSEAAILHGLAAGEMVVTKGAYQVKMAAMSGQAPAHGHEH